MAKWWLLGKGRSTSKSARYGALRAWRQLRIEPLEARLLLSTSPGFNYDQVNAAWFGAPVIAPSMPEGNAVLGSGTQATNSASEWVLRLTPEAAEQAAGVSGAQALLSALPITVMRGLGLTGQLLVGTNLDPSTLAATLANSSYIASFQFNSTIHGSAEPNDPRFTVRDQYALNNIGQNEGTDDADIDTIEAWDVTTGSSSVVTAVIDSGIDLTHPDLAANIWTNPGEIAGDNLDNDHNGYIDDIHGWDFANDNDLEQPDTWPQDDHGHGTHVAGIIGAMGNNNLGVTGVNWNASLMALKFLDENNVGSVADAAEAINYATMMRTRETNPVNVRVINASWGGSGVNSDVLRMAIEASAAADILFVAAAGNGDVFGRGQNIEAVPFFPASFTTPNIVSVAATDRNDGLATFSNYGATSVDIAAPGVSIWSTDLAANIPTGGDGTNLRSGTSMAAPYVAGVASLLWSASPTATVAEVRQAILAGGDPLANLQGKVVSGRRLNANGALVNLPPQAIVTAANINAIGGTTYSFSATFTSNGLANPLDHTTIGNGDFRVTRRGTTDAIPVVRTSPAPTTNANSITATYQFTPPGGSWDALDIGTYDIELVAGEVRDTTGHSSVQKVVKSFTVDLSAAGIFRPTVFTDGGVGSLRTAITAANALDLMAFPNGGTIILSPGTYVLSLTGAGEDANATGDLDVTGKVTIAGSGTVTISANEIDRVLDVRTGATLTLSGVTITGGNIAGVGGGIRNAGMLAVYRSTIDGNDAALNGGGIYNAAGATANVTNSTVSNNDAVGATELQYLPVGSEFVVHTNHLAGSQRIPEVAGNGQGKAFISWESDRQGPFHTYGAFVTETGPTSGAFQISSSSETLRPNSDMNAAGLTYTVQSNGSVTERTLLNSITDTGGNTLSGPASILGSASGGDSARISIDDAGRAVAVWSTASGAVYQRISSGGALLQNGFLGTPSVSNSYPDVAMLPGGGFAGVWRAQLAGDAGSSVYLKIYDGTGNPVSPETKLNLPSTFAHGVRIEADEFGFVVVWENRVANVGVEIIAQRFDFSGVATTGRIVVAAGPLVEIPHVHAFGNGDFYVVWNSAGTGDTGKDIKGQRFGSSGNRIGPELRINTTSTGDQWFASVSSLGSDSLLVAWSGNGVGDAEGVFARVVKLTSVPAGGDGGGIYNAGTLNATNVTISGNSAINQGSGIDNGASGTSTLTNVTVTANQVTGAYTGNPPAPVSFATSSITATNTSDAVAAGDFSGDGIADVIVSDPGSNLLRLYRGNGNGTYQAPTPISNVSSHFFLTVGDFNRDNILDFAVPDGVAIGFVTILLGIGGGNFASPVSYQTGPTDSSACDIVVADFDADGNDDLAVNHIGAYIAPNYANGSLKILWGNGDGTFVSGPGYTLQPRMWSLAVGNIDADPQLELVALSVNSYQLSVVNYVGSRQFQVGPQTVVKPGDPGNFGDFNDHLLADLNVDGKLDLAVVGSSTDELFVMLGNGNGTFQSATVYPTDRAPLTLNAGDFNRDGRQDIAITSNVGTVAIALNTGAGAFAIQPGTIVGGGSRNTAMSDLDGNGSLDIVVLGGGPLSLYTLLNASPGVPSGAVSNAIRGTVNLKNTVVAQNTSTRPSPDVLGMFTSQGGNLIGNVGLALGLLQGTNGNLVGTSAAPINPQLAPLADTGGPTKTHLPLAGSPAIDKAVAGAPATDQRGIARPADGDNNGAAVADVGAVERYHASITGRKFNDLDQDGVQDAGELGIANWTLYLDLNQSGQLDAGEPTAITNAQGDYSFKQLTPGTYTVAEVNQTGWTRTYIATHYVSEFGVDTQPLLTGVRELTMSPDGKHVYVLNSDLAGTDSLVILNRNLSTGALTFNSSIAATGLEGEGQIVMSPDGAYVYAVGSTGNGLLGYSRNLSSGALTQVVSLTLNINPIDLALSSDGKNLYVLGSKLFIYVRNTMTGAISFLSGPTVAGQSLVVAKDVGDGRDNHVYVTSGTNLATFNRLEPSGLLSAPTSIFTNGQVASGGGIAAALTDVSDLAMSPDGLFLYTLSRGEQAVGVYQRNNATGNLTFIEKLARGATDSVGAIIEGLDGAKSIVVSPSGDRVYVTSNSPLADNEGDSITIFRRNTSDGRLFYTDVIKQFDADEGTPFGFHLSLGQPSAVVVGPAGNDIYVSSRDGAITQFARDSQGLDRKTLLIGQDLTGVHFNSYAAPGEIRGTVFNDLNNNGLRDATEDGLPGVTVYLDSDGSNTLNGVERTTVTGPLGDYAFPLLAAPATYTVRLALAGTQSITSPLAQNGQEWTLSVLPDQVRVGADFLVFNSLSGQGSSSVFGMVFQDTNNDRERQLDGSEPLLAGRRVYLDINDNGQFDPVEETSKSVLTLADGLYSITGLGAAKHVVRIVGASAGERTSTPAGNTFTNTTLTTGSNPVNVIAADLNGDMRPDLVSLDKGASKVSVRLQQPGGGYDVWQTYDVTESPTGVAVGKFNNDTLPDIAITGNFGKLMFLLGAAGGGFTSTFATPLTIPSGVATPVAANFNNDAFDDLAIAIDGVPDALRILLNSGTASPSFTALPDFNLATAGPLAITAGKIDSDNFIDLVVANFDADSVQVFRNVGGTSFVAQTAITTNVGDRPSSVVVADLNSDGFNDLVGTSLGTNSVFRLLGNGTITPTTTALPIAVNKGPRTVSVEDIDGDGDRDLIVGNALANDVVVVRNLGSSVFSFPESSGVASFASLTASGVKQVLTTHLNNDGVIDVVAVRGDASSGSLLVLNNAFGLGSHRVELNGTNFAPARNFGVRVTAAVGDYDRNGTVNQADRTFWATHFGATSATGGIGMQADGNNDGVVDAADFTVWRDRLTASAAVSSAASNSVAVIPPAPTPPAIWLSPVTELALTTAPVFEPEVINDDDEVIDLLLASLVAGEQTFVDGEPVEIIADNDDERDEFFGELGDDDLEINLYELTSAF